MRTKNLKAVVIGAGWAGEGHTRALQQQGIEVAAICARQTEAAAKLAWRPCDAEGAFSTLLQFGPSGAETAETAAPIIAFVRLDGEAAVPGPSNGWYFHGDQGLLLGEGLTSFTLSPQRAEDASPCPRRSAWSRLCRLWRMTGNENGSPWCGISWLASWARTTTSI